MGGGLIPRFPSSNVCLQNLSLLPILPLTLPSSPVWALSVCHRPCLWGLDHWLKEGLMGLNLGTWELGENMLGVKSEFSEPETKPTC